MGEVSSKRGEGEKPFNSPAAQLGWGSRVLTGLPQVPLSEGRQLQAAFPPALAHEGRELETAMRSVSKPSALQERDLPSSCKSLVLVPSVANKEASLCPGKQSTSDSCGFSAVELSGALTLYSVFSKTPSQLV